MSDISNDWQESASAGGLLNRGFQRQIDLDLRSLARRAVQLDPAAQILYCVFDDRKSQSGTAGLLRVALIHAIKTLKDAFLMLRRDTDARVPYP